MRKVIPYIASQFRKDKIWLRRTKPSKREYQICLAVDDSSSMIDNHSKQVQHCLLLHTTPLATAVEFPARGIVTHIVSRCSVSLQLAFESLSVIVNALTLLEAGQVAVCR